MKENKNQQSDDTKLNLAGIDPITPYSVAELIICVVAAVVGCVYLYTEKIPLSVVMPVFSACFIGVTVMKFLHIRKVKSKKPTAYLVAVILAVVSLAMTAVTVAYFVK